MVLFEAATDAAQASLEPGEHAQCRQRILDPVAMATGDVEGIDGDGSGGGQSRCTNPLKDVG